MSRGGERERQRARLTAATLNALHELAIAGGTRGVNDVARLAADHARALLGAGAAVVFTLDPDRQLLRPAGETESPVAEVPVAPGEGAIGRAFESGLPVIVDDYRCWEMAVPAAAARGMVAAMAVPLITGDRPLGALGVWTYEPRHFGAEEEQLLTLFAAQVAPALEAARLNQERDASARLFKALHELAVATGETHGTTEMAALCAERASGALRADGATLTWWDAEHGLLRPLAESGPGEGPSWTLRAGEGAAGAAFKWREPVTANDYQSWAQSSAAGRLRGLRSVLAVPLVVGDRAIGTLGVHTFQPREFTSADVELLLLFAAQIAPSLEAARLVETSAGQVRELSTLHEIAVAAGGVLEPRRLAALVVREAATLLGADRSVLRTWDAAGQQLTALADSDGGAVPPVGIGQGLPGLVFESGRPMTVADLRSWNPGDDWAARSGYASAVMVPLVSHQRPTGVLGAFTTEARNFSERETRLLSLLAAQVAPALEAAELADSLHERARVFAALHEVAVAAGGVLDPLALAQLLSERTRDLLEVDRVIVMTHDADSAMLRTLADSAGDTDSWAPPLAPGQGLAGIAFQSGETVRVDDYQDWPSGLEWGRRRSVRCGLAMPLVVGDRVMGVISAITTHRRRFSLEDERLLSLMVAQVAPALAAAALHAELATSERALRAIYDTASVAIVRKDLEGNVLWMNRAGLALFGYEEPEVRELDRAALMAPEDSDLDAEQHEALIAGRLDRYRLERRCVRRNGARFWGDVTIGLVRRQDGGPDFYYTMVEDITERRGAEQALRESEERFRAVFDRAAIGIASLDLEGRVRECNPTLERLLAPDGGGLAGRFFIDLVDEADRTDLHLARLAGGEAAELQVELRYRTGRGDRVWGNTIASSVRGAAARPSFLVVMVEDITLRKAQEAVLEHRAMHDPLTDLPNRNLLGDRLQQAILKALRDRDAGAVLVIDMDGFKQVNDRYGHHCGDELLRQIGERIRSELRGSDTVARLGGDEFAVILPDVDGPGGAEITVTKLGEALRQPFVVDGHTVTASGSIGTAVFPTQGTDPDELMRIADADMYRRKRER